jgi:predicted DNA-binding transcriptional regulator AlpA
MTTKEMLEYTRMARATFYQYRALGTGPQCIKRGRDLLFRSDWVDEWMLSFLVAA